jgi:hypothetical protein
MFEVRVNGQPVYKESAQVIGVSLQSARGELYRAGISTEGIIDLRVEIENPRDPIRLDQLEEARRRWEAEMVQGQITGTAPLQLGNDMHKRQGFDDSTLRPGGVATMTQQQDFGPPSRDLSVDLDPRDSDALTRRLNAYAQHGDADRAIEENGPSEELSAPTPPPTDEPSPTGQFLTPSGDSGSNAPPPESTPDGTIEGQGSGESAVPAGGATPDLSQPGPGAFSLGGEPQPNPSS